MITHRIGRFEAAGFLVRECSTDFRRVMGECAIMTATYDPHSDRVSYLAYSPKFREVGVGETPPMYHVIFDVAKGRATTFEFVEYTPNPHGLVISGFVEVKRDGQGLRTFVPER